MNQVEVTQFNTQFTQYEGKQRGSVVKSLFQTVLANNACGFVDLSQYRVGKYIL